MTNESKSSGRLIAVRNAVLMPSPSGRSNKIAAFLVIRGNLAIRDIRQLKSISTSEGEYFCPPGLCRRVASASNTTTLKAVFNRRPAATSDSNGDQYVIIDRPKPVLDIDFTFSIEIEEEGTSDYEAPVMPIYIDPCDL